MQFFENDSSSLWDTFFPREMSRDCILSKKSNASPRMIDRITGMWNESINEFTQYNEIILGS